MRRRPRVVVASALVAGAAVVVLAPSVVASRYASGPGGADGVLGRPDRGWQFIADAVRESRGAQLGSGQSAIERARDLWAGYPAVAESVDLVWNDGAFTVPVPQDGHAPAPGNAVAAPDGRLAWVVTGHWGDREGPHQMIGLLDYDTGRVLWDIRRPVGTR